MMFRALRRRLADIRYHSAPRPRSRWRRVLDRASVVTLLVAVVVVIVLDLVVIERVALTQQVATIVPLDAAAFDGPVAAVLWTGETGGYLPNTRAEMKLRLVEVRGGWPLMTSAGGRELRVDYDTFMLEASHSDVRLDDVPELAEVRAALDDAFTNPDLRRVDTRNAMIRDHWLGTVSATRGRRPIALLLSVGIWWIMLFVAVTIVVRAAQFATFIARRGRQRRAYAKLDQGQCVVCGYDLTGLEFRTHCPECGALTGVTDPGVARQRGAAPGSSR